MFSTYEQNFVLVQFSACELTLSINGVNDYQGVKCGGPIIFLGNCELSNHVKYTLRIAGA